MKRNILIIDARPIVRLGLAALFKDNAQVTHIFEATNIEEGNRQIETTSIDLVFIHQSLVRDLGILHHTPFVVLVSEPSQEELTKAYQHKARGYLLEGASAELLCMTLNIEEGSFLLDPTITPWYLTYTHHHNLSTLSFESLTIREKEIFDLLCKGVTNNEIAQQLYISVTTAKKHIANISHKCGMNRRQLKIYSLKATTPLFEEAYKGSR